MDKALKKKFVRLLRSVTPKSDPLKVIGEEANIEKFDETIEEISDDGGVVGGFIVGPIGNGKTHFLRFVRNHLDERAFCLFVPEMAESGGFSYIKEKLYRNLFSKDNGNKGLSDYPIEEINKVCTESVSDENIIAQRLLRASEPDKKKVVRYFAGKFLLESDYKALRSLDLKKNMFAQFDFVDLVKANLEILSKTEKKPFVLLLDELDKLYSYKKEITLSGVGLKIVDMYRTLYSKLASSDLDGIILIGATKEAHDLIGTNQAFASRFQAGIKLILKTPKTKEMIKEFLQFRAEEKGIDLSEEELLLILQSIDSYGMSAPSTWRDFCNKMKINLESSVVDYSSLNSDALVLKILSDNIEGLTSKEIIEYNEEAKKRFRSAPSSVLNKLIKERKVVKEKFEGSKSYIYRIAK